MPIRALGLALAFLLSWSPAAGAQTGGGQRRAFEIADYYRTALVGAPAVSPDGRRIVFTVRRYELDAGKTWSELWMADAGGSSLRQLTFGRYNDGPARFSPDGRQLVFVSARGDDALQLYVMPVDGGEARRLTAFPMGVADPVWSPDGRWLAVTSDVYPECGADGACNQRIEKAWSEGKLRAHMADGLLYRHWTTWADGKVAHVLLVDAATGAVVRDLTPGRWPSPVFALGGERGYAFSPDSKELCFVSNREAAQAESTNADLWTVPLDEPSDQKAAVNLTAANTGWDGAPLYSPDGRYIAYRSQAAPGYESDLFRLAIYDRASRTTAYLTGAPAFDDWVTDMAWAPDSAGLVFQANSQGRTPLFRIDLATRQVTRVLTDHQIDGWALAADGGTVFYSRRGVSLPPEVASAVLGSGEPRQLTTFNDALSAEVDIRPAEEMWVPGEGGYKIHVFVVKPHGFDPSKKYPLILNVHGGPQQQWTDSYRGDWQVYPGRGYVVAFANPTGSVGYGQAFTAAISCDWGGRVYRDLMKVTDALAALPYVDASRMGAMGWSYGGYMTMWMQGHTTRFKALASMMGVYDLPAMYGATEELWFPEHDLCGQPWNSEHYRRWSPSEHVAAFKTPTLVITGERDYRVPYTQSLAFFTALQKMKVPSRLIVYPNAGHWPSWYEMAFYYAAHLDWFQRHLGGGGSPWPVEDFLRNRAPAKLDK